MISILTQERLLGVALGGVFVGAVVLQQRKGIYASISPDQPAQNARYEPKGVMFGKLSSDFPRLRNKAVDETLGPVVAYLSSRGW